MILIDVIWADPVNVLVVECRPCGVQFRRPSNHSRVRCPACGLIELWHAVGPPAPAGAALWCDPVMASAIA